jgi:hypothetical protein
MGSLKDAFLKVGIKPAAAPKDENHREKIPKKKITETIIHQEQRNYCEECQNTQPDVEFYKHTNPTSEAEWICLRCADKLKIPDHCRRTAQSDICIKKLFRREFGATAVNIPITTKTKGPGGPVNGNR